MRRFWNWYKRITGYTPRPAHMTYNTFLQR